MHVNRYVDKSISILIHKTQNAIDPEMSSSNLRAFDDGVKGLIQGLPGLLPHSLHCGAEVDAFKAA